MHMKLRTSWLLTLLSCARACSLAARGRSWLTKLRGGASSSEQSYSYSLSTFSPSGRLKQVEYAGQAVLAGALAVAITYDAGVVLASPRKHPSPLVRDTYSKKITLVSDTIALTYSGLTADSRVLAAAAIQKCSEYARKYGSDADVPVAAVVRDLAFLMQRFTQNPGARPFGVSLLVAGLEHEHDSSDGAATPAAGQPVLYRIDPSGASSAWHACAIGKGSAEAEALLEKDFVAGMSRSAAVELALSVVRARSSSNSSSSSSSSDDAKDLPVDVAVVEANGVTLQPHLLQSEEQQETATEA